MSKNRNQSTFNRFLSKDFMQESQNLFFSWISNIVLKVKGIYIALKSGKMQISKYQITKKEIYKGFGAVIHLTFP